MVISIAFAWCESTLLGLRELHGKVDLRPRNSTGVTNNINTHAWLALDHQNKINLLNNVTPINQ